MKISSPVTCDRLIRNSSEFNQEEFWCIAMTTQCELIECRSVELIEPFGGKSLLKHILCISRDLEPAQIIIARCTQKSSCFPTGDDLLLIRKWRQCLDSIDIQFCDYLIITDTSSLSLLQWEPKLFEA